MNKDFKVPKIPIKLQILREGDTDFQDCRLFLSSASRHHHGPETVSEFLNTGSDFIPVELDGKVRILNIKQIAVFRDVSVSVDGGGKPILLTLKNARSFTVQLSEILPENHSRTQDYLNCEDMFLEFISENEHLIVNKTMIVSAVDQ
ncbi:MAG: hypothetical protein KAH24_00430 [Holophagae bacterium]|nr:hypothetical protein [Holophagae bacterium]